MVVNFQLFGSPEGSFEGTVSVCVYIFQFLECFHTFTVFM